MTTVKDKTAPKEGGGPQPRPWFSPFWTFGRGAGGGLIGLPRLFQPTRNQTTLMKLEARMNDFGGEDRFCLEISVFNSEKGGSLTEDRMYPEVVGRGCATLIKHGKLEISLKSSVFEANVDTGEDPGLLKYEDFRGGSGFSKQFNLYFVTAVACGPFGKLFVKNEDGNIVFEISLQKRGRETHVLQGESGNNGEDGERCSQKRYANDFQELTASLYISHWIKTKLVNQRLNLTNQEIKARKRSWDPFLAVLHHFRSIGANPADFMKCMFDVQAKMVQGFETLNERSKDPFNDHGWSNLRRLSIQGSSATTEDEKRQESTEHYLDRVAARTPTPKRGETRSSSKKRKVRQSSRSRDTPKRRRIFRDRSGSLNPSEKDPGENAQRHMNQTHEMLRNSSLVLTLNQMWEFSRHLTNPAWKALGRNLGINDVALISIEHGNRALGFRECYFQVLICWQEMYPRTCTVGNLFKALVKENMVSMAEKLVTFLERANSISLST